MKNVKDPMPMNPSPDARAEAPAVSPLALVGRGVVVVPLVDDGGLEDGIELELVETTPPMVLTGVHSDVGGAGWGGGVGGCPW